MLAIIGIATVLGAIVLGYLLEHGNFSVLWQPAELVIIFGAAFGSMILGSPKAVVIAALKGVGGVFGSSKVSKSFFMDMLIMLSMLFMKIRREGLVAIEKDIDGPESSQIFAAFLKDKSNVFIVDFVCDTMRVFSTVNIEQHEFENIMEADIEAYAHEAAAPAAAINKMADALPGLGIVAAVLGVVITMGVISEPPEVIGHHIGAALVGTFLGVLMCYGIVGPIAANMDSKAKDGEHCLVVVKCALAAFVGGNPPPVALEAGRRAIPNHHRPSFVELEEAIKASKGK
jgi:chemotaxis protein MotA